MSDDARQLPTAAQVDEALVEHDRVALEPFLTDGMDRDMADAAAESWARAYRAGLPLPSITGKPAERDVNSYE
jgi:hypothetical protein